MYKHNDNSLLQGYDPSTLPHGSVEHQKCYNMNYWELMMDDYWFMIYDL